LRKIVIADAGPLIAFARLGQLELLMQIFEQVLVTEEVFAECTCRSDFAETKPILQAAQNKVIERCTAPPLHFELALHVDAGEASAIAAAAEWGCGVLMDDKAGRRMAKNFCVASIGTVSVLVLAKQKQLIPSIKPLLDQLTQSGYFLGDKLIASALAMAGESCANR
jgi:predicted nucleic acid-binding protein